MGDVYVDTFLECTTKVHSCTTYIKVWSWEHWKRFQTKYIKEVNE